MDLLEGVGEILDVNFVMKRVPSRHTIHSLVNKLRSTALLIDNKQKHNVDSFLLMFLLRRFLRRSPVLQIFTKGFRSEIIMDA
jgi:hypothetical protein